MARTLLVVPTGHGVGLTATCLGLVRALDREGVSVGFVKPIGQRSFGPHVTADNSTALVRLISDLDPPEPLDAAHVEQRLGRGELDVLMEDVVDQVEQATERDVVVVEGLVPGPGLVYSGRLNVALAEALDADVLLVGTARSEEGLLSAERIAEAMAIAARNYRVGEVARVVGCAVNRLADAPTAEQEVRQALEGRGLALVGSTQDQPSLAWPRVADIVRALDLQVLNEGDQGRRIAEVVICAQNVPGVLRSMKAQRLLVVPGDRHDVVMAACLAALNGAPIAGLLLTAGIEPDPAVWQLTEAARATGLPVLLSSRTTYPTATAVFRLDTAVPVDDRDRAEAVTGVVADGLEVAWLQRVADIAPTRGEEGNRPQRLSPAAFRHRLTAMARAADARVVLPEGSEPRTIAAAITCHERGIAQCLLLAAPAEVEAIARRSGLVLPHNLEILDPPTVADRYVERLVELRASKGMTPEMARNQLEDPIVLGTLMLERDEVQGLVSGAVHTTAHTVRPALQLIRTAPGAHLVSSVFFMLLPDDVLVYGDCAINPNPDAEQLADIAVQSAASAQAFGIEPRVAMISFSTGASGSGSDVEKVAEATEIVRQRAPHLAVDGPLQYDAAVVASVGSVKRPGSAVAGRANVFIFPDLNTGNTTYKAVQRSAGVVSIGPMLQGLAKPVNDLSRGALVDDIVYTIALTAVQAASRPTKA